MMCRHQKPDLLTCITYACIISSCFVFNLYLLVPREIQKLAHADARQIKWRAFSVLVTCLLAVLMYPQIFCEKRRFSDDDETYFTKYIADPASDLFYVIRHIFGLQRMVHGRPLTTVLPLVHVVILYSGSFVTSILEDYILHVRNMEYKQNPRNTNAQGQSFFSSKIFQRRKEINLNRVSFSNPWQFSRDFIFAPLTEELIFRACIIPPFLYNSQWTVIQICWTVPWFFGFAHVHHAIQKYRHDMPIQAIIVSTLFQLSYTTLFGAYACYSYIKSGSLLAIVLVHSFCNFMGLPNVYPFLLRNNAATSARLQKAIKISRIVSGLSYAFGIYFFWILLDDSRGIFKDCPSWWLSDLSRR